MKVGSQMGRLGRIRIWAAHHLVQTVVCGTALVRSNRAFFLAATATAIFYYPSLRNNSLDAGMLYAWDVLGVCWPTMAKTQSLIASLHLTAIDFSTFNGSSDYFLAPNFPEVHPFLILYSLIFSPASTSMQDLGHLLVLMLALHCFLSCYFSAKYLTRFLALDFKPAALAATAFAFGGNIAVAHLQPQFIFCISILPWAAYGALAYSDSPSVRRLLTGSMPVVIALLAGYLPLAAATLGVSIVLVITAIFLVGRNEGASQTDQVRRLLSAFEPYLLGFLVVSPYLLAVTRFLRESPSSNAPSLFFSAHQLAQLPQSLLTLISSRLSVPGPLYEFSFSAGPLALAIFALFLFGRNATKTVSAKEWKLLMVSATIYFTIALATFGHFSAVSDLVYYFVPQVGRMHIYQRFLLLSQFFFALMIAIMLRSVVETRPITAISILIVVFVTALVLISHIVASQSPLAQSLGVNNYVVFEIFLGLLFLLTLRFSNAAIIYVATIALFALPTLNRMYEFSSGNEFEQQRAIQPMALDDAQKARLIAYLKRFSNKAIIKYVDLTPLWNGDHREPFPKSFPYHVLNQVHLSSFHGFEFRLAARAEYLQAMPIVYKDGSWQLTPDWDLIEKRGADFVVAYESDLKDGALAELVSKINSKDLLRLPNGVVVIPLTAVSTPEKSAPGAGFDNGFFRIVSKREVEPQLVDIARGKHATQSSTLGGREASRAVDGDRNGDTEAGSVSHTDRDKNAWLDIDLGTVEPIDSVGIWNVTGCCGFRLNNYWIFISENPFKASDTASILSHRPQTWARVNFTPTPHAVIKVGGFRGRYVRVQLGGDQPIAEAYLHLAEVEVFRSKQLSGFPSPVHSAQVKPIDFSTNYANDLRLDWESAEPTTVQYLFSGNPRLSYYLNGGRVTPTVRKGLITIDAPRGRNTIEVRYRNWPLSVFWVLFGSYGVACLLTLTIAAIRYIRPSTWQTRT